MRRDGHIHTPFCPHGTKDELEKYIEKALQLGFKEISFTEHAPLPPGFIDPAPTKDSAIDMNQLETYFAEINRVKCLYKEKIKINAGLEVDYIEGYEEETKTFLNKYGQQLDDAILSVHFLKNGETYDCLDYSPDIFSHMIEQIGSLERLYKKYYETVALSIDSDLGQYKPRRIGHITLVKKFQKKFPMHDECRDMILPILHGIKRKGYELDYNGAGTAKPLCREPYPPEWVARAAIGLGIPLIYGSDAHQAKELMQGAESLIIK